MPTSKTPVHTGDVIVLEEHRVGETHRIGEILEVLGEADSEHYRVRWDDGRETIFYPHSGSATIKPRRS